MSSRRETLVHLGKPDGLVEVLGTSFRVPGKILALANRLLPLLDTDVQPVVAGRRDSGSMHIVECAPAELLQRAADLACEALSHPGSIGIVVPDELAGAAENALHTRLEGSDSSNRVSVVPVGLVKGLEFDSVVLVEPALIALAPRHGLRLLYIALTRAVSELTILHTEPLPAALRL